MPEVIALSVEDFATLHPALNGALFAEHARVALARFHASPASLEVLRDGESAPATIQFASPDPRSVHSLAREDFVEIGAIVLAGLLLTYWEGKQITRVVRRGGRVDYFVGEGPGDERWILEVSGTDEGSLTARRNEKREQLQQSPYHQTPHSRDGFVAVTRFAPPATSLLEKVPAAS